MRSAATDYFWKGKAKGSQVGSRPVGTAEKATAATAEGRFPVHTQLSSFCTDKRVSDAA